VDEVVSYFRKDHETKEIYKNEISITSFYIGEAKDQSKKHPAIRESIAGSDFVFLDLMGADSGTIKVIEDSVRTYDKNLAIIGSGTQYLRDRTKLGAFEFKEMTNMMGKNKKKSPSGMQNMNMDKMTKMSGVMGKVSKSAQGMQDWLLLQKAWSFAGFENIKNMILLIFKDYGNLKNLPDPGKIIDYSNGTAKEPQ
jgi:cobaltochelatase CobN